MKGSCGQRMKERVGKRNILGQTMTFRSEDGDSRDVSSSSCLQAPLRMVKEKERPPVGAETE